MFFFLGVDSKSESFFEGGGNPSNPKKFPDHRGFAADEKKWTSELDSAGLKKKNFINIADRCLELWITVAIIQNIMRYYYFTSCTYKKCFF